MDSTIDDFIENDRLHQLVINEIIKNEKNIKSVNPPDFIEISGEFFHTNRFTDIDLSSLQYSSYFSIEKIVNNLKNRPNLRLQIINDVNLHKEMLKKDSSISKIVLCNSTYIKNDSLNENSTINELINIVEIFNEISLSHNEDMDKYERINKKTHLNKINSGYYNSFDD